MPSDFHVWTFVHDVSGLARIELKVRTDADGANDPATTVNETYAGGAGVSAWTSLPMTLRAMPQGEPWPLNEIDFTVLPTHIADQAWVEVAGYENVLLDYYVEAEDQNGLITRSPIQHVWVGESNVIAPSDVVWTDPDTLQAGPALMFSSSMAASQTSWRRRTAAPAPRFFASSRFAPTIEINVWSVYWARSMTARWMSSEARMSPKIWVYCWRVACFISS